MTAVVRGAGGTAERSMLYQLSIERMIGGLGLLD
jgi:hypothetical protein